MSGVLVLVGMGLLIWAAAMAAWTVFERLEESRPASCCRMCPAEHVGFPHPAGGYVCADCSHLLDPFCRVCGCTEDSACWPTCSWVEDPFELGFLCSCCGPRQWQLWDDISEMLGSPAHMPLDEVLELVAGVDGIAHPLVIDPSGDVTGATDTAALKAAIAWSSRRGRAR